MPGALVAWKPKNLNRKNPGIRIRCLDPLSILQRQGFPAELFDETAAGRYSVVVFQKLYDRANVDLAARLKGQGTRILFDICDDPFYNPFDNPLYEERAPLLREMLSIADVVTTCSTELGRRFDAPTRIVRDGILPPDPVTRFRGAMAALQPRTRTELVWYGNSWTSQAPAGMRDLLQIQSLLETLARDYPLRLTVISNSEEMYEAHIRPFRLETRYLSWRRYERFWRSFPAHDICLLPIDDNPYTRCKSNNRLALSLYLGVAVVADPIPSYQEFAPFCALGDWEAGLRRYLEFPALRKADAAAGREYVSERYMAPHAAADWRALFEELLGGEGARMAASSSSEAPACPI